MIGRKRTYVSTARSKSQPRKKQAVKLGKPDNGMRARYIKAKLTYSDTYLIDPGLGTAANHVLAANGLYDVDITGVGHQPACFDQFMALYSAYIVTKAHIKVKAFNTDSANSQIVTLSIQDQNSTSLDCRQYIEQGNCVWKLLGRLPDGNNIQTLEHEVDIAKFSGHKIFNDNSYEGTSSTNPPDTHYFVIGCQAIDQSSNSAAVRVWVEIQYEVYFRDPALVALS